MATNDKTRQKRVITMLLLGESGVGKSTFINAFVNYLSFKTLDAVNGRPKCLIPVNFTIADPKTRVPTVVTLGVEDDNENTGDPTSSVTQYPRCYTFNDDNIVLNIIDTPGIVDTNGVDKDNRNMQNILDFISTYEEINAICVLLKPNEARLDVVFKYGLFQLFTHLNKSAANNIVFLFTNSRSTDYLPGDSGPTLIKILDQIRKSPPNVDIPYNENTTFCFDSESFRYLVATVPPNEIQFNPRYKSSYTESWDRSVEECERLLTRIKELPPHKVMDTISLNNAKQIIQLLPKPLADIEKKIADNVKLCDERKLDIIKCEGSLEELREKLYTPSIELIHTTLESPKIVCGDTDCCTVDVVDGVTNTNYTTECYFPGYLNLSDGPTLNYSDLILQSIFSYINGSERKPGEAMALWLLTVIFFPITILMKFLNLGASFTGCKGCGHRMDKHIYMTFETQRKVVKKLDPDVEKLMITDHVTAELIDQQIQNLDREQNELRAESETIAKSMSTFACFLISNALTPVNDAFGDYVRHLISNERNGAFGNINKVTIARLEEVLAQYEEQKEWIMVNMQEAENARGVISITAAQINDIIDELCSLKHNGHSIRTMIDIQRASKMKCHDHNTKVYHNVHGNIGISLRKLFAKYKK